MSALRRTGRIVLWTAAALLLLVVLAAAGGWLALRASLPATEGDLRVARLDAPVVIERDALGIPTIRATSRLDAARALGFTHAQERFFQMDLLRRQPAGELSGLFGERALASDRPLRVHRFRERARRVIEAAPESHRALIAAYADGVNEGLRALGARPFEYLVLRERPAPWTPEDSILVVYAMYLDLQDEDASGDSSLGVLRDVMPPAMFDFLAPRGTEWDSPIDGTTLEAAPIPGPEVFTLRETPAAAAAGAGREGSVETFLGSNNFAVNAARAGRAMVAGDMHLGIDVPIIWYRASLVLQGAGGAERRITGVTLPGTPFVVAGSNGDVAWAFTNSYGDWGDLVVLGEEERGRMVKETIAVRGGDAVTIEIEETPWGPVIDRDHRGRRRALRWVAQETAGVNMNLAEMEDATTLEEAMAIANRSGIPAQNFVAADRSGRIGWTIMGAIPRRRPGADGRLPITPDAAWTEWLDPSEYPRVVEPADGAIWTANARVVGGTMLEAIGDGGYALGARGGQIRDALRERPIREEKDLLAIQLDDRAIFLARWQALLLETLTPEVVRADPRRAAMRRLVESWGARAAVDSAGYRLVRAWRTFLEEEIFTALTHAAREADSRFRWQDLAQREHALWALVSRRPAHLLDPKYDSWEAQMLAAADRVIAELTPEGATLEAATWGARNTSRFRHPLAGAIPFAASRLEYPKRQLPGDSFMPRVQSPVEGASQRMVVSPGREELGIFHMPGGQSGHPLSPHFTDGHDAWVEGRPTPFLPGPAVETLRLGRR